MSKINMDPFHIIPIKNITIVSDILKDNVLSSEHTARGFPQFLDAKQGRRVGTVRWAQLVTWLR